MNLPFHLTVRLPDGSEHTVSQLIIKRDGTIARIDTHGINGDAMRNGWYTIEADDLELVELIVTPIEVAL